jgi:FkbM family methyltransferase
MTRFKKIIRALINPLGYDLVNYRSHLQNLDTLSNREQENKFLLESIEKLQFIVRHNTLKASSGLSEFDFFRKSAPNLIQSNSQLFQDLLVLYCLNYKRIGYFVEFGATDGIKLSNTYLLEKDYGWTGILCEPGKIWQNGLAKNRTALIDYRCVWSKSGEYFSFNQAPMAELSTLESFNDSDSHADSRKDGLVYQVETVSLNDLLEYHNAPLKIDYLSIDTEGSELDILAAFNFSKYDITIITVEHNYSAKRGPIFDLLVKNGYKRIFDTISSFDDWYIKANLK